MELADVVKLYAPLAGMLAMAFWMGRLQGRIDALVASVAGLKEEATALGAMGERLARFEERQNSMGGILERVERALEALQRQMANAANLNATHTIIEMPGNGKRG